MRAAMRICVALLVLGGVTLGSVSVAIADYLEVRRSATIKASPVRDAQIYERPSVGTRLQLLDNGDQTSGYYRVLAPVTQRPGWIYRTLVRRYPGNAPGTTSGPVSPQPGPTGLSGDVMRAHFIDVWQGDAALLEFSCGVVLIDAGGQNDQTTDRLVEYLDRFFERRTDLNRTIDAIVVTHTHIDHNRALRRVVETFTVRNYIHNGVLNGSGRHNARWMVEHANDDGRQISLRAVSQAEIASLDHRNGLSDGTIDPVNCAGTDPQVRVLSSTYESNPGWPQGEFQNGNNKSVVVRIDFGEASFLFTGDLEEHAIDTLVEYFEGGGMLDVDVYQVGHHGSHNGTTDHLMAAMTPEISVLSMGPSSEQVNWSAWAYGHPRRTVVDSLDQWIDRPRANGKFVQVATGVRSFFARQMQDAVYGTGWDGTIILSADAAGHFHVEISR